MFVVLLLVGFFKHLITPEFMCAEKQRLIDCSTRHIACGHLDGVDGNHLVFFLFFMRPIPSVVITIQFLELFRVCVAGVC